MMRHSESDEFDREAGGGRLESTERSPQQSGSLVPGAHLRLDPGQLVAKRMLDAFHGELGIMASANNH